MKAYNPKTPFSTPMKLLIPISKERIKGTLVFKYPDPEKDEVPLIFGTFRTFGGTELNSNDTVAVIQTATIETWFRPDIKSNCRIYLCETQETFEIKGAPENILMRNQFLKMKVQKIGGDE